MPKKTLAVSLTPEQMQAARSDSQSDCVAVWADLIKRVGAERILVSWQLGQSGLPQDRTIGSAADLHAFATEAFKQGHRSVLFRPRA